MSNDLRYNPELHGDHICNTISNPRGKLNKCLEAKEVGIKYDEGKLRYDLIPPDALRDITRVITFGATKYKPNNWKLVEGYLERYTAALMRHMEAFRSGEYYDQETGIPHLAHVGCNCLFLLHLCNQEARMEIPTALQTGCVGTNHDQFKDMTEEQREGYIRSKNRYGSK